MMTEQQIIGTLKEIGFKDHEISTVIGDVVQLISAHVLAAYLPTLPEDERARITAFSPTELQSYLAEHAGALPAFPQAQFEAIHDETWKDYFASMRERG